MKERGGGNGSDRPRWAGDGLLEIRGAQSCWLIWSVCSFWDGAGVRRCRCRCRRRSTAPPAPTLSHLHFPTGHFSGEPLDQRVSTLTCPGTRAHREGRTAGKAQGQAGKGDGVWEPAIPLCLPSSSSSKALPPPQYPQSPQAAHAWALTEVIHLFRPSCLPACLA